jgi:uncharacterized protein
MYIKRRLEGEIKANLFQKKVVVVYGARQVGKTTMVKKIVNDLNTPYSYLNCDNIDVLSKIQAADNSTSLKAVIGENQLVIIDEAQRVRNIGLKLKLIVDNFPDIQIIATGSSSFDLANEIAEPLTGRNIEFWLFPLGLDELFGTNQIIEADRQLVNLLVYGSYPDVYQIESNELKAQMVKNLASNYLYKDICEPTVKVRASAASASWRQKQEITDSAP